MSALFKDSHLFIPSIPFTTFLLIRFMLLDQVLLLKLRDINRKRDYVMQIGNAVNITFQRGNCFRRDTKAFIVNVEGLNLFILYTF